MKFNPKARLDRSQVKVRRGGGGGMGFPMPGGGTSGGRGGMPIPTGGGIGGIILFIIILVVASQCSGVTNLPGVPGGDSSSETDASSENCDPDNLSRLCKATYSINSIQAFWNDTLPDQAGVKYTESDTVTFEGSTSSHCGQASSAMGPFYCPVDKTVYLDLTFFDDMLKGQLGAQGGDFAEAYVVAHEYGHHVQDLVGTLAQAQSRETGPKSPGVRVELQADCYAGIWAHYATTVEDEDGEVLITELTDDDIARAIDAAKSVGDDRIQQRTQGRVNPEQWTHGSAESRVRWFQTGYQEGTMEACDTFSTDNL